MENLEKLKNKNFLIVGSGFQLSIEKSYIRAFRKLGFKKLDYLFLDQGYLSILNKFNYSIISKTYYLICRIILINFLNFYFVIMLSVGSLLVEYLVANEVSRVRFPVRAYN